MRMATFFDLPLELRDHIYTIILTIPSPNSSNTTTSQNHDTNRLPPAPSDPDEVSISWPTSIPPAASTILLLLSRQIHREATLCMRRLASQGKLQHRLSGTLTAGYVLGISWQLVPVATRRIAAMAIGVGVEAPSDDDLLSSGASGGGSGATRFDARLWWRVLRERTGKILYTLVCQAIRFQHVDPSTGPRFLLGGPPRVTIDELVLDFRVTGRGSWSKEQEMLLEEWIPHCVRMLKRVIQLVTKLDGLPSDLMSLPVLRKRAALRGIGVIKVGMGGRVMDSFNVEEHFS